MRCAIYTRVSTDEQGWAVVGMHEDSGFSGRDLDRPAIRRGEADAVIACERSDPQAAQGIVDAVQVRESITKFDIIRTVLQRLNDAQGDRALKARRDIVQRVVDLFGGDGALTDEGVSAG